MDKLLILVFLLTGMTILYAKSDNPPDSWWIDGYCVQRSVITPLPGERSIRAEVDGAWQDFPLVDFPESYWQWNTAKRHDYLEIIREMMSMGPQSSRRPELAGPHNGMVATYGMARKDSAFKLNNAVKGMGFCPKPEKLEEIIALLEGNVDSPMAQKLEILDSLYTKARDVFAADRQLSLELYSEPGFNTQTFINQMVNPACVTVFLDVPTFKLKQIARLLHPDNPGLSNYERQMCKYVNLMHSFFHGEFPRDYIGVVYYNVEVYDSSPGRDDAKGTKLTP